MKNPVAEITGKNFVNENFVLAIWLLFEYINILLLVLTDMAKLISFVYWKVIAIIL